VKDELEKMAVDLRDELATGSRYADAYEDLVEVTNIRSRLSDALKQVVKNIQTEATKKVEDAQKKAAGNCSNLRLRELMLPICIEILTEKKTKMAADAQLASKAKKAVDEKRDQTQLALVAKKLQVGPKCKQFTLSHSYIRRATVSSNKTHGPTCTALAKRLVCSRLA
jgi:Flp pilus assembly protein TadG